jgi:hypothetical protein
MTAEVMNPTGVAFNQAGELFVTARADGEVCRINNNSESLSYASDMGIATGIAFDKNGSMYIGDRSGTIYRVTVPETRNLSRFLSRRFRRIIWLSALTEDFTFPRRAFPATTPFTELIKTVSTNFFIADSADRRASPLTVTVICMSPPVCTADTAS